MSTTSYNDLLSTHSFVDDEQRLASIKCFADGGGCLIDTALCQAAASCGHIQSLQYLHENCSCPLSDKYNPNIIVPVIRGKNIHCLKYVHKCGEVITSNDLSVMVMYDQVEMLQYAVECGIGFNSGICEYAVINNSIDSLRYIHRHGALWDRGISNLAVVYKSNQCIQYAIEHDLPPPSPIYMDYWNKLAIE